MSARASPSPSPSAKRSATPKNTASNKQKKLGDEKMDKGVAEKPNRIPNSQNKQQKQQQGNSGKSANLTRLSPAQGEQEEPNYGKLKDLTEMNREIEEKLDALDNEQVAFEAETDIKIQQLRNQLEQVEQEKKQWEESAKKIEEELEHIRKGTGKKINAKSVSPNIELQPSNNNTKSKNATTVSSKKTKTNNTDISTPSFNTSNSVKNTSRSNGAGASVEKSRAAASELLKWCKKVTQQYCHIFEIKSFNSECWKNGVAFCALFYACCSPEILQGFPQFEEVMMQDEKVTFKVVSQLANKLNINFDLGEIIKIIRESGENPAQVFLPVVRTIYEGLSTSKLANVNCDWERDWELALSSLKQLQTTPN